MDDVDPLELAEKIEEKEEKRDAEEARRSRLNAVVAVTIALLATFMGISKVKDDNLVLAMNRAQARRIDDWNFYQSKNIRQEVLEAASQEVVATGLALKGPDSAATTKLAASLRAKAEHEKSGKNDLQKTAEGDDKTYQSKLFRHQQFDLSEAALAVAVSLLAITSLTRKTWLYGVALVPTLAGVAMGLSGLFGWHLHPESVISWLD